MLFNKSCTPHFQILKAKSPLKSGGLRSTAEFKSALTKKAGEMQARKTGTADSNVSPMKSPGKVWGFCFNSRQEIVVRRFSLCVKCVAIVDKRFNVFNRFLI